MRRYWLSMESIQTPKITIDGELFHHIFGVCRQKEGSCFEVLTKNGNAYLSKVLTVSKKTAEIEILEERIISPLPSPQIHLALSISRFPVMDAVIEKAVEMGVHSFLPFFSEFSFLRKKDSISNQKIERWEKIVRSATQQSGRGELMIVEKPSTMEDLLIKIKKEPNSACIFAYEGNSTHSIKNYLETLQAKSPDPLQKIWLILGSEGGFSYQEVEHLEKRGIQPVSLGEQILRVETAAIALTASVKYAFGLMGSQISNDSSQFLKEIERN